MRTCLTTCAMLAALAASLTPAVGRAQNLGNPDPVPEVHYREVLMGRYAAPGRCETDDVSHLLVLTGEAVQIGPLLCEGLGKMTWDDDGWLGVPLSVCRVEQREQEARTLWLRRETGGDLSVRSDAAESFLPDAKVLQRCGP